jgi:hypothetical protein
VQRLGIKSDLTTKRGHGTFFVLATIAAYIIGLLTNWSSQFVNPILSRKVGTMWSWWRQRSEAKKRYRDDWIKRMATDDHWQLLTAMKAQGLRTEAVKYGGLALFGILLSLLVRIEPLAGGAPPSELVLALARWVPRVLILGLLGVAYALTSAAGALEEVVVSASRMDPPEKSI